MAMCGPNRMSTLPLSGTWCENAVKPVLPTKGAPLIGKVKGAIRTKDACPRKRPIPPKMLKEKASIHKKVFQDLPQRVDQYQLMVRINALN